MFNSERLLGKIIKETLGGGTSGNSKGDGLFDSLTSGKGLMTAIGLGVGAFEILKNQKAKSNEGAHSTSTPSSIPSGHQVTGAPPPPIPGAAPVPPSPPPLPSVDGAEETASGQDLALRMIQVMIAAAHADGILDEAEEKAILDRLRGAELDSEEKMFLVNELHQPKPLSELTDGIDDPETAKTMYMLAVATIDTDTEAERIWLDELGTQLGISSEIRNFIEEAS